MTMAYFASFDMTRIGASTLMLSTAGKPDVTLNLTTLSWPNAYTTTTRVFNHAVALNMPSLGPYSEEFPLQSSADTFLNAVQFYLRALASTATWTSPSSITLSLNTTTWLLTFSYSASFTAITFGNTETRRLFGFSGAFSGSSASVTGSDVPKYIIVPDVDGASSATPVLEEGTVSSSAYSGGGRGYALSRSTNRRMRKWTQQYEPKGKTFRKFALSIPNEFTYQHLFEQGRAGYPFGVYGGFGENVYEAYVFRAGQESFHATPATPGNPNQFHIPFDAYALGRF